MQNKLKRKPARIGWFIFTSIFGLCLLAACSDTNTLAPSTSTTPAFTLASTTAATTISSSITTTSLAVTIPTANPVTTNPSTSTPTPVWFKDIPAYDKSQMLQLEAATLTAATLDPARFITVATTSVDPVPTIADFYSSKLKEAGWQLAPKNASANENLIQQLNFTRTQNGTSQLLIILIGRAEGLKNIPQTAALAPKVPAGQTLILIATPTEPVVPPTTGLPEGVAAKNSSVDFGDGWVAQSQITFPSSGTGPFPTIILVHGSGLNDMDETFPESVAGVAGGSKFFRSIAYKLPTRGMAVVRYNKRGVIGLGPQLSIDPKFNNPANPDSQYAKDAAFVLNETLKNPLVDPKRVIMLGHSEGTLNVSHVAVSPDGKNIAGVVLMGVQGYDLKTTLQYQLVDKYIQTFQQVSTTKNDKMTVEEILNYANSLSPAFQKALIGQFLVADSSSPLKYKYSATLDKNGDGLLDLQNELRPLLEASSGINNFPNIPALGGDKAASALADWQQNGSVTSVLPAYKGPVLLLNGEADIQTIVQGAREVEVALAKAGHNDHTLKTYPGLGHTFYPAKGLEQPLGPPQEQVLKDLGDWLSSHFGH